MIKILDQPNFIQKSEMSGSPLLLEKKEITCASHIFIAFLNLFSLATSIVKVAI